MWFFAAFLAFARSPRVPQRRARHDLAQRPRAALHFNLSSINCIRFSRGQPFVSACQLHALHLCLSEPFHALPSGTHSRLSESFVSHSHTHTRSTQVTRKIDYGTIWTHDRQHALGPLGPGGCEGVGGGSSSADTAQAQPSCAELSPELRRAHASSGDDVDARAAVAEVRVVRLHDLGLRDCIRWW